MIDIKDGRCRICSGKFEVEANCWFAVGSYFLKLLFWLLVVLVSANSPLTQAIGSRIAYRAETAVHVEPPLQETGVLTTTLDECEER